MLDRGGVALGSTSPYQFAVKALEIAVPAEMNTPNRREQRLEMVRIEMLKAREPRELPSLGLDVGAIPITLRAGECPESLRDP